MSSQKYRTVIAGSGRIAGWFEDDPLRSHPCTHIGAYRKYPQINVTACSGKTMEQAKKFAERWDIPGFYDDVPEMLRNEKPDIVSVCTPAETHHDIVMTAVDCGAKAIFCEKALATSLDEADEMITACRKNGVRLTVNHTRRWCHDFHAVHRIIDDNLLGKLHSVTGWFSGSLVHTGTHFFDMLLYFCGACRQVRGFINSEQISGDNPMPDAGGYAFIEIANGVCGIVNAVEKIYYIFEMELLFDSGRIRIGNGVHELWNTSESTQYEDFIELKKSQFPAQEPGERNPLILAVGDIINSIETDRDTASTGEDARSAFEIALAVYESHRNDGAPVELPLASRSATVLSK